MTIINEDLAAGVADGLRSMAAFFEDNPELAPHIATGLRHIGSHVFTDATDVLRQLAEAAARAGHQVNKRYTDNGYASVEVTVNGAVRFHLQADRDEVCERVVTGTREVTEQVPDPELVAAVPLVERTRVEEIVEWRCRPLLAAEQADPVPVGLVAKVQDAIAEAASR